jgi:HSP20 family molecular chaperone IbpA
MKDRKDKTTPTSAAEGLDGILRGLGNLLQTAVQMAENVQEAGEVHQSGSTGSEGLRAVYGVSVRVGPGNVRRIENFGNLRQRPGQKPVIDEFREPMTDLLDEGDYLLVIVELPGIEESGVEWKINGDTVVISARAGARKYHKKLRLPSPVDEKRSISSYKNGILELKLWKQQAR